MNRCAVLSDGITDNDNAAFSVSQTVSMETSRAKQKLPIIQPKLVLAHRPVFL